MYITVTVTINMSTPFPNQITIQALDVANEASDRNFGG